MMGLGDVSGSDRGGTVIEKEKGENEDCCCQGRKVGL
jgi:hypothetical protein